MEGSSSPDMPDYEVTSEIYSECNYKTTKNPIINGNVVSEFPFEYPRNEKNIEHDEDGDLIVERACKGSIQIEHSMSTALPLVGLQVWRGALLLGDLALHWGHLGYLKDTTLLEVGAGTGLSSFVAAMYAKKVICTDVDIGGILQLIKENVKRNKDIIKTDILVTELDFTKELSPIIEKELPSINLVFAADVIYDDRLTESFMNILEKLLNKPPTKSVIIALEKRYVFTMADLDSVAPCYETFLSFLQERNIKNKWTLEQIPIDFPQYFQYDRVKELVLWKIQRIH